MEVEVLGITLLNKSGYNALFFDKIFVVSTIFKLKCDSKSLHRQKIFLTLIDI